MQSMLLMPLMGRPLRSGCRSRRAESLERALYQDDRDPSADASGWQLVQAAR